MVNWKDKKEFWITGAKLADPEAGKIKAGSILVQKGLISEIQWQKKVETELPVFDCEGFLIAPGFIDIHTHLREPGNEDKETIATGTAAAVAGGYTSILCMANTDPVIDDPSVVEYVNRRAQTDGNCRVYVTGAVTKGLDGEQITEFFHLKKAGIVALSDDGRYIANSSVMRTALEYARMLDLPVIVHCEDPYLTDESQMNESYVSTRLGLKGAHAASEEIAVARDIRLAQLTGARLHIAHVSTEGSLELIKAAKKKGVAVTAEVSPHHLTLDESLLESYDRNLKVNPPLRGLSDIAALRTALNDGTIDCIATDHAPHTEIDKQVEFNFAPPGMTGLETSFAQLHTELVLNGKFELIDLIRMLTTGPAGVIGLSGGKLAAGVPADLVLIDPKEEWVFKKEMIRSKASNTPLIGKKFTGRIKGVFLEGRWCSDVS
ncbi:MAG: dihydroorotase [Candidatus Krumholzibacteriota bacterium]|nr:dihydroorotase [Candidatus Krumholzibacteriota bacterium]